MIRKFTTNQKLVFFFSLVLIAEGLFLNSAITIGVIAVLSILAYLINIIFNIITILNSVRLKKRIISVSTTYSILYPLTEDKVNKLAEFVEFISKLDYPEDRLQILLLVKENDKEIIKKLEEQLFPKFFKGVIVPSEFKSRSKVVNYGSSYAAHEQIIIYNSNQYNLNQNIFINLFSLRSINPYSSLKRLLL